MGHIVLDKFTFSLLIIKEYYLRSDRRFENIFRQERDSDNRPKQHWNRPVLDHVEQTILSRAVRRVTLCLRNRHVQV